MDISASAEHITFSSEQKSINIQNTAYLISPILRLHKQKTTIKALTQLEITK
jgi:hypothetical protein